MTTVGTIGAVTATQRSFLLPALAGADIPYWIKLAGAGGTTEIAKIRSFPDRYGNVSADRGAEGSVAVAHTAPVTVTQYDPNAGGSGGGVTVTGSQGEGPFSTTNMKVATASDLGGGSTGVGTAIVSTTDPGAIGAGNLWLRLDPSQTYPPILYVRNPTDDGWADEDGSGYVLGNGLAFYDDTDALKSVAVVDTNNINLEILGSSTLHLTPNFIELTAGTAAVATFASETTIAATDRITLDGNSANPGLDTLTIVDGVGVELKSDAHPATIRGGGDALILDGTGVLKYNGSPVGTQAAHVADGSTVDQLRDALIASGLMAAS